MSEKSTIGSRGRRPFVKMQGLGNDFVVFDAVSEPLQLSPEQCRRIADRRYGIGCDQILIVAPPSAPDIDFDYKIHNADGSEVGQCGNGVRCLARFVASRGLSDRRRLRIATATTTMQVELLGDDRVRVELEPPRFAPADIPLAAAEPADRYTVRGADGHAYAGGAVSMGNPHFVLDVADVGGAPVAAAGAALTQQPDFPEGANIGFMQVVAPDAIRLRVYERGAGETLACGSGACAAVAVGRRWGVLDERVDVALPGGHLEIEWAGDGEPLYMTGAAAIVFEGEIEL